MCSNSSREKRSAKFNRKTFTETLSIRDKVRRLGRRHGSQHAEAKVKLIRHKE